MYGLKLPLSSRSVEQMLSMDLNKSNANGMDGRPEACMGQWKSCQKKETFANGLEAMVQRRE